LLIITAAPRFSRSDKIVQNPLDKGKGFKRVIKPVYGYGHYITQFIPWKLMPIITPTTADGNSDFMNMTFVGPRKHIQ